MTTVEEAPNEDPEASEAFDPEGRVLCADDACIGVVGAEGRCKVCGRPGPALAEGAPGAAQEQAVRAAAPTAAGDDEEDDEEFRTRRLCADGACIGVIGPEGRCKVCGCPEGNDALA